MKLEDQQEEMRKLAVFMAERTRAGVVKWKRSPIDNAFATFREGLGSLQIERTGSTVLLVMRDEDYLVICECDDAELNADLWAAVLEQDEEFNRIIDAWLKEFSSE